MNNDLISRSALCEEYEDYLLVCDSGGLNTAHEMLEAAREFPAVDAEVVRHGKNLNASYKSLFKCSECDWECWDTLCGDTDTYNYCPSCGAKMDAEVEG